MNSKLARSSHSLNLPEISVCKHSSSIVNIGHSEADRRKVSEI
ncbi:hypothetical protein NC652_014426 [Populus alba x Populus x berolinensis]|uniref:Uncharacterized protein n=1 Tax=Populus alba x Populus x berolinensis TaxID=444605 RepID=A0AAD6QWU9_9ROSI|nr:hypothetical protein NC652_014426 [Populus alba x Populus x berolinensis]KAJ6998183.1 hypothetical protein NC653_014398 [Populus alba x Populus x berolinensis]